MDKIALVTGAAKGIGYEVVKQLSQKGFVVILTARDAVKGNKATAALKSDKVYFCQLDVANEQSIQQAFNFVKEKFGRLDVLVNNAGIFDRTTGMKVGLDQVRTFLENNTLGPLRLAQVFVPLMKRGKIINVSSGMGQLSEMNGGHAAYRISKTALNAVTKILAEELKGKVNVNCLCPGWVRTDMGGVFAERSVEKGAETIVWLAVENDKDSGKFFRDKKEIPW